MDSSPNFEGDTDHSMSTVLQFPHTSSSSSGQNAHVLEQSAQRQHGQSQMTGQPKFSNGPHIRSRITVVCAECKRLKLKCDRRTPCSSCIKRDTVQRCVYSQAAAEKIDVQSLHNRILILEGVIAQLTAAAPSTSVSSALGNVTPFKAPFSSSSSAHHTFNSTSTPPASTSNNLLAGLPCNDRALLAVGASGSSVMISLEDVASIWLAELDEQGPDHKSVSNPDPNAGSGRPSTSAMRVKLEPTPVMIPPAPSHSNSRGLVAGGRVSSAAFVPPLPYDIFLPSSSAPTTHVSTPSNPYPPAFSLTGSTEPPQVTPALLSHLPSSPIRTGLMKAVNEAMLLHPCFNIRHFEKRVKAMLDWGDAGLSNPYSLSTSASGSGAGLANGRTGVEEYARDVLFGTPFSHTTNGKPKANGKDSGRAQAQQQSGSPKPTLSFFAATCSALALGALVERGCESQAADVFVDPLSNSSNPLSVIDTAGRGTDGQRTSPAALFALSEQALSLFEKTSSYDLDAMMAMLLQVLFQLHDGQMNVAQGVLPLVGKMIQVARIMGLAIDPDEFPGTYSLFEAELRRRIWWSVFYYDLFISDCLGHPPLIPDNSFTTRLPADVDEDQFTPSSTTLPILSNAEGTEKGTAYLILKLRLAQLVKNIKRQIFKDPLGDDFSDLSLDQAATLEGEISSFLADLPPAFLSPVLIAQRCELAILANRLTLKLYLPFLKESCGSSSPKPSHQAVLGTITAAHVVIYASRLLHSLWRHTRPAIFDFYDFGRALFDAAIVCAHTVIQQPSSILAAEAMKAVSCALEVMQDIDASKSISIDGASGNGSKNEAIRVVEVMKRKAEASRGTQSSGSAIAGSKRKRSEPESESLSSGFQLPFVGPAVASTKTDRARPMVSPSKSSSGTLKDALIVKTDSKRQSAKEKDKDKEKEKEKDKNRYPPVGIRVRPSQAQSSSRQRTASTSTIPPTPTVPSSKGRASVPTSAPPSAASLPPPTRPLATPVQESSAMLGYENYASSRPTTRGGPPLEPMQREDYTMQYTTSEDSNVIDRRRYSSQSYDSPSAASLFDPASLTHPSPTSYSTGPTPPGYYMSYAPTAGPSSGYDNSPLAHSQSTPIVGLGIGSSQTPMDTSGNTETAMSSEQQYYGHEKPHSSYTPPMGKAHDYPRSMTHEYQLSSSQHSTVPGSHVQGWQQASASSDGWNGYKPYYG